MSGRSKLTEVEEDFLGAVRDLLLSGPAQGFSARQAAELRRMIAGVLRPGAEVTQLIGTVCTTGAACAWLGVSRQALAKAVAGRRLIGLKTADGKWVYPTWQFTRAGLTSGLLGPAWDVLVSQFSRAGVVAPSVAAAAWFLVPHEVLGVAPSQWVGSRGELAPLLRAARSAVAPAGCVPLGRLSELKTVEVR